MSLVVFLYLCIDSSLPCGLIQLPLGDLEEVGRLPEAHLSGADHVDGVLEGLLLGHLGAVDADALELEAGLEGGVCGERKKGLKMQEDEYRGKTQKGKKTRKQPNSYIRAWQIHLVATPRLVDFTQHGEQYDLPVLNNKSLRNERN